MYIYDVHACNAWGCAMCVNEVCMHVFKCVCYIKCICNVCLGNYNMHVGVYYVIWVYTCVYMHVCTRVYV